MKNLLVIGFGPHARTNHLPALAAGGAAGLVGSVSAVDVATAAPDISAARPTFCAAPVPVTYLAPFQPGATLPGPVRETLDALVAQRAIDAVVVSTEPSFHLAYVNWALDHGLGVLLDKPLSIHENCSVDPAPAAAILTDFEELAGRYRDVRTWQPRTLISVHCQRRYHPAFLKMRELIAEVAAATNCPVTSIQSFHCDGQWRMPDELLDISYHSFDRGYGKCAHSGYHFFDIVAWLIQAGERPGKEADTVEVYGNFLRPRDFLAQLAVEDYRGFVPGFQDRNPYSTEELLARTKEFGEVDAFLSMAYKSGGRTVTLGSVNLLHNGYSQRGGHAPRPSDLYKGNGRVRQESHIIQQGPFQAIHYHSWQTSARSAADGPGGRDDVTEHAELHVLRNARFNPRWQPYTKFDRAALTWQSPTGPWLPTQADARHRALQEFLEYVNGLRMRDELRSELTDHRRSAVLMSGAYLSAAQQWVGRSPVAVLDFGTSAEDDVLEVR